MEPPLEDYFTLFELAPVYDIDEAELTARYRRLQHLVHPDRYSAATAQERRLAAQRAALVNEAYHTLRDPLARARYLLALRGADLERHREVATEFLMEQMELRERLEELRASPSLDSMGELLDDIRRRLAAGRQRLAATLADEGGLEAACRAYHELQYLQRLHEEALDLEEHLRGA